MDFLVASGYGSVLFHSTTKRGKQTNPYYTETRSINCFLVRVGEMMSFCLLNEWLNPRNGCFLCGTHGQFQSFSGAIDDTCRFAIDWCPVDLVGVTYLLGAYKLSFYHPKFVLYLKQLLLYTLRLNSLGFFHNHVDRSDKTFISVIIYIVSHSQHCELVSHSASTKNIFPISCGYDHIFLWPIPIIHIKRNYVTVTTNLPYGSVLPRYQHPYMKAHQQG